MSKLTYQITFRIDSDTKEWLDSLPYDGGAKSRIFRSLLRDWRFQNEKSPENSEKEVINGVEELTRRFE